MRTKLDSLAIYTPSSASMGTMRAGGTASYHQSEGGWQQLDSHHSYPDGSPNRHSVKNDTQTDAVLVSDHFFYFGSAAVEIPESILETLGYENRRNHRTFDGALVQLSAPENRQNGDRVINAGRNSLQDSVNQIGQEMTRRNLNVQPTLTERPGLPVRIIVNRDLVLRPYQPLFFNRGTSR